MILTEDRNYTISLELEDCENQTGLSSETVELEFTNKELLHAVITCGMPLQRLTPAWFSKRKSGLLYKIFLVETALDTEGDRLKKSKNIAYLDSSEKSVMSYYLGMFFTKLISRRLYGVDYLTHLNLIEKANGDGFIDFFAGEWRPDMIGYRMADDSWSVWEAKGGSNRREQALRKGSQQVEAIASVNGAKPDPAAVCMTYYERGYLCGVVRDPDPDQNKGEQLGFGQEQFWKAYYRPVFETFLECGAGTSFNGARAEVSLSLPCFTQNEKAGEERRILFGMPKAMFRHLMEDDYGFLKDENSDLWRECCPAGGFMGKDGIFLK